MTEQLVRVVAPHFVAGFVMQGDICTEAAPILRRWVLGRNREAIRRTMQAKGWQASILRTSQH